MTLPRPIDSHHALLLLCLLVAAATASGCTGLYSKLPCEADHDCLVIIRRHAEPVTTVRIPTLSRHGRPVAVAVHDSGPADAEHVLVCVHGVLSDHKTWRYFQALLGSKYRILLVDLPGCGDSDCPHPKTLDACGYSPDALASHVLQALEQHLADGRPRRITLVGHSLGGLVALRALSSDQLRDRHYELIGQIEKLVLLDAAHYGLVNPPQSLRSLASTPNLLISLAATKDRVASVTRDGFDVYRGAMGEETDNLHDVVHDHSKCRAFRAIIEQALPVRADCHDWCPKDALFAAYRDIDVPCLILWGTHDDTLGRCLGHELDNTIPDSRMYIIPQAKHSPQIEQPFIVARLVDEFASKLMISRRTASFVEPVDRDSFGGDHYWLACPLHPSRHEALDRTGAGTSRRHNTACELTRGPMW